MGKGVCAGGGSRSDSGTGRLASIHLLANTEQAVSVRHVSTLEVRSHQGADADDVWQRLERHQPHGIAPLVGRGGLDPLPHLHARARAQRLERTAPHGAAAVAKAQACRRHCESIRPRQHRQQHRGGGELRLKHVSTRVSLPLRLFRAVEGGLSAEARKAK